MNPSEMAFKNLLDDELFIQWMLHPDSALDEMWQKRMDEDEGLKKNILALKEIIKNLKVVEKDISQEEKNEIWNNIQLKINQKKKKRAVLLWTVSAAASLMLIIAGFWVVNQTKSFVDIDYSVFIPENEDVFKSGKINIILSDNERIDIDKDSIVISYDTDGTINVDSEVVQSNNASTQKKGVELNQLVVPYGKITSLILSDGTKIWVNSGSRLVYPIVFEDNRREIYISGEAFMDVAKNDKAPFIVKTDDIELNVLGTSFNISAYSNDEFQSVVLASGSVEVKSKGSNNGYKIEPNHMLSYIKNSHEVNIKEVDVDNYISWIHGYLITNKERLDNVFSKLSRHFNVEFSYIDEKVKYQTVSGKLDLNLTIEDVLNNISLTAPFKYQINNNQVHIELN